MQYQVLVAAFLNNLGHCGSNSSSSKYVPTLPQTKFATFEEGKLDSHPPDSEADSLLAVAREADSSYATKKRGNFEADSLLAVAREADSSYATKKRDNFEADCLLAVARVEDSSYAS